jgi:23S rRNA (pseudouridine1915-N3)-methyltransferase
MKKIQIRAVGKLQESWQKTAVHMYETRLAGFGGVEVVELPEGHGGAEKPDEAKTRAVEAAALLRGIPDGAFVAALDGRGKEMASETLAKQLDVWVASSKQVVFLIGGSWGLHHDLLAKTDAVLSFGPMTFPHGLARVMLLEQIYRAKMIGRGSEYHK